MRMRQILGALVLPFLRNRFNSPISKNGELDLIAEEKDQELIGKIENEYVDAGVNFAMEASFLYFGKYQEFDELFEKWAQKEIEYADLGYRTMSFDRFLQSARSLENIDKSLLRQRRTVDEAPILHSRIFKNKFQDMNNHKITNRGVKGVISTVKGTLSLPSTENPNQTISFNYKFKFIKA